MIQVRGTEGYALGDGMRFDKGTCNAAILPFFLVLPYWGIEKHVSTVGVEKGKVLYPTVLFPSRGVQVYNATIRSNF